MSECKRGGVWLVAIVCLRVLVRMLSRPTAAWHGMATVEFSRDGTADSISWYMEFGMEFT